ncbi:RNA polymerase II subunit A C-terminal domain phosphatase-like [Lineus longissimus]|uniref:RNA polymerase II subunit A C-terminal domain phosphatase-like n=1 Tax=Lineus longissimus TaxID=88925 RepID=UPI00315D4759
MAASAGCTILFPESEPAKLLKWKIKKGYRIAKGSLLALYSHGNEESIQKLKSQEIGLVEELLISEGETICFGTPLIKIKGCDHPVVMKDMCAECGEDLRERFGCAGDRKETASASVAMVHSIPELTVSEAEAFEIGHADEQRLLTSKKLVLLVDLDQTLLHTTNDNIPPNLKDVVHFQLWHGSNQLWYHTKFRPGTEKFLKKIATMYELHICTFGVRMYAHMIARHLDPEGKLFSHRILSRDECFDHQSKTANLKALFPCGDVMVCIIDDREDVWNRAPNLIHVKPYRFFQGTADINAPPGMDKTDDVSAEIKADSVLHHPEGENNPDEKDKALTSMQNLELKSESESNNAAGDSDSNELPPPVKEEVSLSEDDSKMETDSDVKGDDVGSSSDSGVTSVTAGDGVSSSSQGDVSKEHEKISNVTSSDSVVTSEVVPSDSSVVASGNAGTVSSGSLVVTTGTVSSGSLVVTAGDSVLETVASGDLAIVTSDIETVSSSDVEMVSSEESSSVLVADAKTEVTDLTGKNSSKDTENDEAMKTGAVLHYQNEKSGMDLLELQDEDDYLLYLEDILTNIHNAYYNMHDEFKGKGKTEVPDLKNIIPYVKRKVLKGANIVFSCVFPRNIPPEKNKEYQIAKSLGADIQDNIIFPSQKNDPAATTHLVAAKVGTMKVNQALKRKHIHVVTPDWLWCCYHRWEKVTESLFHLTDESSATSRDSPAPGRVRSSKDKRKRPDDNDDDDLGPKRPRVDDVADDEMMEADNNEEEKADVAAGKISKADREFRQSLSMYALSMEELEEMDKEVDDIISGNDGGESSESSESSDSEIDNKLRQRVLSCGEHSDSSSGESLGGEYPRGWKRQHEKGHQVVTPEDTEDSQDVPEEDANHDRRHKIKIGVGESDSDSDQYNESIGSVDEEMAQAVEKEFLGWVVP